VTLVQSGSGLPPLGAATGTAQIGDGCGTKATAVTVTTRSAAPSKPSFDLRIMGHSIYRVSGYVELGIFSVV